MQVIKTCLVVILTVICYIWLKVTILYVDQE